MIKISEVRAPVLGVTDSVLAARLVRGDEGDLVPVGDEVDAEFLLGVIEALIRLGASVRPADVCIHDGTLYVSAVVLDEMGRGDLVRFAREQGV